jgi:flagellar basal-body rod modification protein FlgD
MPNQITGLTTPFSGGTSSTAAQGSSALGKNEFLKLLTAQLANQDPTAPTDNQAFIAQLAQFSSVEQAQATNSNLESLLIAQSTANQQSAANFIGKDVIFKSPTVGLTDQGGTVLANLASSASTVKLTITDSAGKVVKTLELKDVNAGPLSIPWDGRSDQGFKEPAGTYTVAFDAKDAKGNSVSVDMRGRARVTGVSLEAGYPELIVNNVHIKMNDVLDVLQTTTPTTTAPTF